MKSTHKVVRFDYSKFESENPWDHDALYEYEFWGFHKKRGRMHIDTKRYKKACKIVGIDDFMPSGLFAPRNTVYFIPKRKNRYDYKVNIFRDLISSLKNEWVEEYKPLFNKIKSPKEVYEESRLNAIACTSCSDDYDEIDFEARMAALRRESSYAKIINACYCMFLQKLVTEIDRYTLLVMVDCGYKEDDFSFESFLGFTAKITGNDEPKSLLTKFSGFNCYNLLRKINNFLKHNSVSSYRKLKKAYPSNVCSVENKTANAEYQNGQFAGDWIILKDNYIDIAFEKLQTFFEQYCEAVFKEDIEESKWNYDEYFVVAYENMKRPEEY